MCRNITALRGLDPPATREEVEAAARQYARKVAALTTARQLDDPAFAEAVGRIADATQDLLDALPPRRTSPPVEPPLRRIRSSGP